MDDFDMMHLEVEFEIDEAKLEAMRNGGGEALEDGEADCEGCKI